MLNGSDTHPTPVGCTHPHSLHDTLTTSRTIQQPLNPPQSAPHPPKDRHGWQDMQPSQHGTKSSLTSLQPCHTVLALPPSKPQKAPLNSLHAPHQHNRPLLPVCTPNATQHTTIGSLARLHPKQLATLTGMGSTTKPAQHSTLLSQSTSLLLTHLLPWLALPTPQ